MSYSDYEVPDGITPLVGYRGWTVKNDKLWSAYPEVRSVEWPTHQPLQSECISPLRIPAADEHDRRTPSAPKHYYSPHIDCTCGIYALHEFPKRGGMTPWPRYKSVTGMIHGWGKIIVGDKGFRAQYAKPIALVSHRNNSHEWPKTILSLAERYGLEIVDYREVRK